MCVHWKSEGHPKYPLVVFYREKETFCHALNTHKFSAALQWDNDYNQISCFKASGSGKNNTLHATSSTCSKYPWGLTGESFHLLWAQTCWGHWEHYLPVHVEMVLLPEVIQNLLLGLGKQVIFSLSERQQFDTRCPGICRWIYLVLWFGLNFCEGIYRK